MMEMTISVRGEKCVKIVGSHANEGNGKHFHVYFPQLVELFAVFIIFNQPFYFTCWLDGKAQTKRGRKTSSVMLCCVETRGLFS